MSSYSDFNEEPSWSAEASQTTIPIAEYTMEDLPLEDEESPPRIPSLALEESAPSSPPLEIISPTPVESDEDEDPNKNLTMEIEDSCPFSITESTQHSFDISDSYPASPAFCSTQKEPSQAHSQCLFN